MRKALFLSLLVLCAAPVAASDPAHCDATAFTLAKPAAPGPKVEKPKAPAKTETARAEPKNPLAAATKPKTSSRLVSNCDAGKKKPS